MTQDHTKSPEESEAPPAEDAASAPGALSLSSKAGLLILAVAPWIAVTGFTSFEYMRRSVFVIGAGLVALLWFVELLRGRAASFGSGLASLLLGLFTIWTLVATGLVWSGGDDIGPVIYASYFVGLGLFALPFAAPTGRRVKSWEVAGAVGVSVAAHGVLLLADAFGASPLTTVWNPLGATGAFGAVEFAVTFMVVALPCAALGAGALFSSGQKPKAVALAGLTALGLAGALAATVGPDPGGSTWASGPNLIEMFTKDRRAIGQLEREPVNPRFAIMRLEGDLAPEANGWVRRIGMARVEAKPVQGHGPGGWWRSQLTAGDAAEGWGATRYDDYPALRTPHSGALMLTVELGAVGSALFYGWLLAAIALGVGAMRRSTSGAETLGLAALVVAVILGGSRSFTHTSLFLPSFTAPLIAAAATLSALGASSGTSRWAESWRAPRAVGAIAAVLAIGVMTTHAFDLAASYYRSSGDVFMLYSRFDKARDRYIAAAEMIPAHGETSYNIALAMERTQSLMEAGAHIDRALALSPNDARAHYLHSKFALRELRFADGRDAALETIARFPNHFNAYKNVALYHSRRAEYQEAADVFAGLLERELPDSARALALMELAELYENPLGKPALAMKSYKEALPLLEDGTRKERARGRIPELEKRVERERLEREGKPVPPTLMPANPDDHEGHDHQPGTFHPH